MIPVVSPGSGSSERCSHLPTVTELNTGGAVIGVEVWVALAWVPGAQVAPYLIGGGPV